MGKVSRRAGRALRHVERREPARVFRDGATEVLVAGPLARDPFDALGVAGLLDALAEHVLAGRCEDGFHVDDLGNRVTVTGPVVGDPDATAEALGSLAEALRGGVQGGGSGVAGGGSRAPIPLRGNRQLADIGPAWTWECALPLREAA